MSMMARDGSTGIPSGSSNTSKPSSALIRVYSDSKQVGAYSNLDNAIAEAKRCLSISSTRIVRLERI